MATAVNTANICATGSSIVVLRSVVHHMKSFMAGNQTSQVPVPWGIHAHTKAEAEREFSLGAEEGFLVGFLREMHLASTFLYLEI